MNEPGATAAGRQLADTFLFTARGTPLVYYGDEIALGAGATPTTGAISRADSRATLAMRSRRAGAPPRRRPSSTTCAGWPGCGRSWLRCAGDGW